MKNKLIPILLFALIFVCSLFALVGCNKSDKLQTPDLFGVDEDNVLSWVDIDLARGYKVRIDDGKGNVKEVVTDNTTYSLDNLEVGEYFVSVCAIGNNRDKLNSDWSEKLDFQRGYSTGLVYKLIENDTAYAIVGVGKAVGDVVIEDYYRNNKPVLMIGTRAFKDNRSVTSVTVGKNVSQISEGAFYGCNNLKTVILPEDLLYIGESAFQNCTALESVNIPSGVSTIYPYTFAFCRKLKNVNFVVTEIQLDNGDVSLTGTSVIGTGAFQDCREISELVLPATLKGVESGAFTQMTALSKIAIPDNVEYINSEAFSYDSSLTEVTFGEQSKATYIGKKAFLACTSLTNLQLGDNLTEIDSSAFAGCSSLDNIKIPESVFTIGVDAFYGTAEYVKQTEAEKLFIFIDRWLIKYTNDDNKYKFTLSKTIFGEDCPQDGIIGIAVGCFDNSGVEKIILPASVRYLSSQAFSNCAMLKVFQTEEKGSSTVKSELEKIGSYCFYKSAISEFYLPSGLKSIGNYAFYACENLEKIDEVAGDTSVNKIPESVVKIGRQAFRKTKIWKDAADDDGIVRIDIILPRGSHATPTCWIVDYNNIEESGEISSIRTVDMNAVNLSEEKRYPKVAHLADYAFYLLDSLTKVENSSVLKSIGAGAFYGCTSLESIVVGRTFKTVNPYTFYGCKSLTKFSIDATLSSELSEIGAYAFYDCERLSEFSLKTTKVTRIAPYSFAYCYRLRSFDFAKAAVNVIDSYAFYADFSLEEIKLPDSLTTIGYNVFFECDALKKVQFGNGVKYIYDSAFYNCSSLRSVELPASLLYLGNKVFYKCYALTNVKFNTISTDEGVQGLKYIGNYAFFNDERLGGVDLPGSLVYIGKYAFKGVYGLGSVTLGDNLENMGAHVFYGLDNLTVYTSHTEKPLDWSGKWNSFQRPVVYGCVLDENEGYVKSLTITENTFSFTSDYRPLSAPRRNGMTFRHWATENGDTVYSETELKNAPLGTTLFAVWDEVGDEWYYEKNAEGRVVFAIVGKGAIPEELTITSTKSDESTDKPSDDSSAKEDYFAGGSQLCGWSYIQGGEPVFLRGKDFMDERLSLIPAGTKIYAVYYDANDYANACQRFDMRVDMVKKPNEELLHSRFS